jgi:hypothetical protein
MDLTNRAMIASLSIRGIWSAVAEDERVTAEVAQKHGVSAEVGRYMKKICDPKKVGTLKEFNSARSTLYNLHRTLTLAWDDKAGRMLPAAMYFDYMAKIGEAKQRMVEKYEAFLLEMPLLQARAQVEMNGLYRAEDWPDPNELRQKVEVRVRITPLADASDFRVQLGAEEEAKIKEQVTRDLYTKLTGALGELVGNLKTCVLDTQERLAKYEVDAQGKTVHTFRDTAITNLREMVANARKLNVVGDPGLTALFDQIDGSLCRHEPQALRDNFVLRKQAVSDAGALAAQLGEIEKVLMAAAA